MTKKQKTAGQVRKEAYGMARDAADEREKEGDPEGAGVIRDLAQAIKAIPIRLGTRNAPWLD
jgi:hypothetical protein